jgi:hypothetical protein
MIVTYICTANHPALFPSGNGRSCHQGIGHQLPQVLDADIQVIFLAEAADDLIPAVVT